MTEEQTARFEYLMSEADIAEDDEGRLIYRIDIPIPVSLVAHHFHGARIPSLLELIDAALARRLGG